MTLDHNFQIMDLKHEARHVDPKDWKMQTRKQAYRLYRRMQLRGFLWRLWRRLIGKSHKLIDFIAMQTKCELGSSFDLGLQTIPLHLVNGSVDRVEDFDAMFFLKSDQGSAERWMRAVELYLLNENVPAVDVIQVGERYFVKDGHHRVSAARAIGMKYIDAQVCVLKVKGQLPWINDPFKALRRRQMAKTV